MDRKSYYTKNQEPIPFDWSWNHLQPKLPSRLHASNVKGYLYHELLGCGVERNTGHFPSNASPIQIPDIPAEIQSSSYRSKNSFSGSKQPTCGILTPLQRTYICHISSLSKQALACAKVNKINSTGENRKDAYTEDRAFSVRLEESGDNASFTLAIDTCRVINSGAITTIINCKRKCDARSHLL